MKSIGLILLGLFFILAGACKLDIRPNPRVPEPIEAPAEPAAPASPPKTSADVVAIVDGSTCPKFSWVDRGRGPVAYFKGVAMVYARQVCAAHSPVASIVSRSIDTAKTEAVRDRTDALSLYASNFRKLGLSNDTPALRLRHSFALLVGLGMRESSGKHCCGLDTKAGFSSTNGTEAGAFQVSANAMGASPVLKELFATYKAKPPAGACLLDVFRQGVTCTDTNWKNWGSGEGLEFQRLEKECPAFATETAAVLVRILGGTAGHFGPLRRKEVEVVPACVTMLAAIDQLVAASPEICSALY